LHKKFQTKCAKLVDEKNDQLFCCHSVRDYELKILFKGVHLTNSEKMFDRKLDCLLKKKRKLYCLLKKIKISICHRTTFNSVLNMRKICSYSLIKRLS